MWYYIENLSHRQLSMISHKKNLVNTRDGAELLWGVTTSVEQPLHGPNSWGLAARNGCNYLDLKYISKKTVYSPWQLHHTPNPNLKCYKAISAPVKTQTWVKVIWLFDYFRYRARQQHTNANLKQHVTIKSVNFHQLPTIILLMIYLGAIVWKLKFLKSFHLFTALCVPGVGLR